MNRWTNWAQVLVSCVSVGLWGLVNNAGILHCSVDAELHPISVYRRCMEVNFLAAVNMCQIFLPLLRTSRGRIVNMCSLAGRSDRGVQILAANSDLDKEPDVKNYKLTCKRINSCPFCTAHRKLSISSGSITVLYFCLHFRVKYCTFYWSIRVCEVIRNYLQDKVKIL